MLPIERILETLPHRTVGLVGDLFLDRYLEIDAAKKEPSVETGLIAYQVVNVRSYPGALGTVLNNLAALGVGTIVPITLLGSDGEGYEVKQALAKYRSVDSNGIVTTSERRTPTYTKPMLHESGSVREMNRLDIKNRTATAAELESEILLRLERFWPDLDAVIVLDQVSEVNCGVVTHRVRERISELAERTPEKFVLADSRERIRLFRSVSVKPNRRESDEAGGSLSLAKSCGRTVFETDGEAGIRVKNATEESVLVPGYPVAGPIDICGAGDSCSAGIASAKLSGLSDVEAAAFGNLVASITVQQLGITGTAPPEKVRQRWREVSRG
jgi:bifunctional ADP-heptose synthase (sugar kinase/adenylyltransferase)